MTDKIVWANNGEDFQYETMYDAMHELYPLKVGLELEYGEVEPITPKDLIDVDDVLEMIGERAYDLVGEHADNFPDCTTEEAIELENLIWNWMQRTLKMGFYKVKNTKTHTITLDDIEEFLDGVHVTDEERKEILANAQKTV